MTTATTKRPEVAVSSPSPVSTEHYLEALSGIVEIARDLKKGYREDPKSIGLLDTYIGVVNDYADQEGFGNG